jgi:hypothetical protein
VYKEEKRRRPGIKKFEREREREREKLKEGGH